MRIILFFLMCGALYNAIVEVEAASRRTIIIGDSHALLIGLTANVNVNQYLTAPGWGIKRLLRALGNEPVQRDVKTCYVSIGTNDGFAGSESDIQALAYALAHTFPCAEIVIIPGSWGWGRVAAVTEQQAYNYYEAYSRAGCTVAPCAVGYSPVHPGINTPGIQQITQYITN